MRTTLVIPVRNEEGCIGRVLKEVDRKLVHEIIVVDGHSTDTTINEARSSLKINDKIISQKRSGFGSAVREGVKKASGDIIIIMDGDGSHNPKDIKKMLKKYHEGYEYVMASRYVKGGKSNDDTFIRFIGNKSLTLLTNLFHGTCVSDSLYLFTVISKQKFESLHLSSHGFELCIEILVKAHKKGLTFAEVPAIERARYAGESKVNAFVHGYKILRAILRSY